MPRPLSSATEVFEILMREHAEMLLAFLRSSVRDPHAVDDLFQETMVIAWRRIDDFDRSRSFGKWIRGIAGKLVMAHFRKAGKNPLHCDAVTLEWLESRFERVEKLKGDTLSVKLDLLKDCIAALSDDNRQAIEARYLELNSLEQIVNRFGITLQTAKKRLYRAKIQLEACLAKKLLAWEESA